MVYARMASTSPRSGLWPGHRLPWPEHRPWPWLRHRQSAVLALAGLLAFGLGVLVYGADRPLGQAQWAPWLGSQAATPWFGAWGGSLPTAVHVLAFSLWTAALLPVASPWRLRACAAWTGVNLVFELAQHPHLQPLWTAMLAGPSDAEAATDHPALRAMAAYLARGHFDPLDLAAAVLGGLLAAAVVTALNPGPGAQP